MAQYEVHYLIAALAGTGCSVGWSMGTNFLWIWRPQPAPTALAPPADRMAGQESSPTV